MATHYGHNEDSSGNILLSIGNGITATVEMGTTASQAYPKGTYLFFDNKLCKTNVAVANGATLSIGANLVQTNIGAELASHLKANNGDEFYFDYKNGKPGYYPNANKRSSEFVPFGGDEFTMPITLYTCAIAVSNGSYTEARRRCYFEFEDTEHLEYVSYRLISGKIEYSEPSSGVHHFKIPNFADWNSTTQITVQHTAVFEITCRVK